VVLSLNLDEVMAPSRPDLRALAEQARRLGLPALAYAGLLVVALGVAQREPDAMSILVTVLFVLLTSAAASSWDLLVKVSEDKRRRTAGLLPTNAPDSSHLGETELAVGQSAVSDAHRTPRNDVKAAAEPEIFGQAGEVESRGD
jgi:hypothetical protein